MRPLRIELQAFGSYPGKEVVDFRLLAHRGLFVITGETGTGKTTIFDAMCYALYGEMPSKEGKDIRSHHAASSMPTYVVFEFEIDGVTYSVRREPEQERAARRGGETTLDKAKAQLDRLDTGASLATKSSDVNARCVELVGLKADQFKKAISPSGCEPIVLEKRSYTAPENCYVHGLQSACNAGPEGQSERAGDGAWAAPSARTARGSSVSRLTTRLVPSWGQRQFTGAGHRRRSMI